MTYLDMTATHGTATDRSRPDRTDLKSIPVKDRNSLKRHIVSSIIEIIRSETEGLKKSKGDVPITQTLESQPKLGWDEMLDQCAELPEIVTLIRLSRFKRIADRIAYLIGLETDPEPDESPMNLSSLKGLADFLRKERRLEEPKGVGQSPDGCIVAEWHYDATKHLAIKFLDEERVAFASISPSRARAGETKSLNGSGLCLEAMESLKSTGAMDWKNG